MRETLKKDNTRSFFTRSVHPSIHYCILKRVCGEFEALNCEVLAHAYAPNSSRSDYHLIASKHAFLEQRFTCYKNDSMTSLLVFTYLLKYVAVF